MPDPNIKNWRAYGDSINSDERIEKRTVDDSNQYLDIHPNTEGVTNPCPSAPACPSPNYDDCGNLTFDPVARVAMREPAGCGVGSYACGPGQEFVYDFENRVTSIHHDWLDGQTDATANATSNSEPKVLEFVYDALGRRVETKEYLDIALRQTMTLPKITRHVYVGLENIQDWTCGEADPTCNGTTVFYVKQQYLWGDPERYPEPVAMLTPFEAQTPPGEPIVVEAAWHYLHDVLGSVIGLVDATGKLVERYTYDPYGKVFVETWDPAANENQGDWEATFEPLSGLPHSAYGNPWMWTGQRYDAAVGLYAFWARSYSPTLGRWLQRDPIGYAGGSLNLHEYVLGNPLYWIDPYGLSPWDWVQGGLDVVGLVPFVGELADGTNALISLAHGDRTGAALSAAAMIPIGGQAATAAKGIRRAAKLADEAAELAEKTARELAEKEAREKAARELAEKAAKQGDCPGDPIDHHKIPRKELKQLPPDVRKLAQGRKGRPNIQKGNEPWHKRVHRPISGNKGGEYNKRAKEIVSELLERKRGQTLTPEDFEAAADQLMREMEGKFGPSTP